MRRNSKANAISELVNVTTFSPLETGVELTTDHRYLVNEEFKMFLHFVGQLSRNHDNGRFDERNEFACKCAKTMVTALEQAGLYERRYWEDRYDEVLEKSFD